MKKVFSYLVILTLVLGFTCGAHAKNFELKLTTIATEKDPWGQLLMREAKAIEKNTNGTVKVTVFLAGKLGTGIDTIKQVARGRIDMGAFQLTDAASMVKELALLGTPYLFDSSEQRDCVLDEHLAAHLDKMFQKKGLKLIHYLYAGTSSVASTIPIYTPADAKDVKIRSNQASASIYMWKTVGASPVPLPMVEFPAALQTGLVKGGPIVPVYYLALGFNKVAPHYTLTEHFQNTGFIIMNLKKWNRLSKEQQKQIMDSVEPAEGFRKQIRGMEAAMVKKYEEAGGPVHRLTPEQKQQWLDVLVPGQKEIVDMVGGNAAELWDVIRKAKASCGK